MTIKAMVDTIEDVPEALRDYYKPAEGEGVDGKFVLSVEASGGYALENVEGLKSSFGRTKAEADEMRRALESYKGIKEKPSELIAKLTRLRELEALDPETEADKKAALKIKASEEKLAAEFGERNKEIEDRLAKSRSQIERLVRSDQIRQAALKHGGDPDLLEPFASMRTRVRDDDNGDPVVEVLDDNGLPEFAVRGGKAEPATVDDLIMKMKADPKFGRLFSSSGVTGTGAKPANGSATGGKTIRRTDFDALDHIRKADMMRSGVRVVD